MKCFVVDAFTRDGAGGNPAGVVLDPGSADAQAMQALAASVGFSETAFVVPSDHATHRVRFFAPGKEVDLCGHATIATWHLLHERGLVAPGEHTMETAAGLQRVRVDADGRVTMTQNTPQFLGDIAPGEIAGSLGLSADDFVAPFPCVASTGLKKIFAFVRNAETLMAAQPDLNAIAEVAVRHDAIGIYLLTHEAPEGVTALARNFAPVVGIAEDSATGTSAAAVSCVLAEQGFVVDEARIFQGDAIGIPAELLVELEVAGGSILQVMVGGFATTREPS